MGWIMGTRLNIFTQQEQVEFISVSLCHGQLIEYHHYCLSLARPNDMKIIIVQECHGLSWSLQTFYSIGEDKVKWALISSTIIHMRATQYFHHGLLLGTTWIKRKEIQRNTLKYFWSFLFSSTSKYKGKVKTRTTIYTEKLPTSKKRTRKSFWVYFLVLLISMHGK